MMVAYKIETTLQQDGEVTLNSLPFQAGERVEITVLSLPRPSINEQQTSPIPANRYPQPLREEYEALIHKKLRRTITTEEAARLEAVRAEINQIDRQSKSWSQWEQHAAEIDQELANLRQELETLPDA